MSILHRNSENQCCLGTGSAEQTVGVFGPGLTSDVGLAPEEVLWIVLLLDFQETGIVLAVEFLLEVWLVEVALVSVGSRVRGDVLEALVPVGGDLGVELLDLLGGRGVGGVRRSDDEVELSVSPGGEDRVLWVSGNLHGWADGKLNTETSVVDDVADSLGDTGWVVLDDIAGDETATKRSVVGTLIWEESLVGSVEVWEGGGFIGWFEAERLDLGEEWFEELVDFLSAHVWGKERIKHEGELWTEETIKGVGVNALVGVGWSVVVVPVESLIEGRRVGSGESQMSSRVWLLFVELGGDRVDDAISSWSSTGQCPVQVGVLLRVGNDERSIRENNLEGKSLIGSKTVNTRQRTVASTLNISSSVSNRRALSTDSLHADLISSIVQLSDLDTGVSLDGWAFVPWLVVVLNELGILQVVSPDGKSTMSS